MNEPKEEARRMVERFKPYADLYCMGLLYSDGNLHAAKECALICCDEILKVLPDKTTFEHGKIGYWSEVKKEIELL